MNKLFKSLLIFIITLLLLSGCTAQHKEATVTAYLLETKGYRSYKESTAQQVHSIEFEGKAYTGEYKKTYVRIGNNFRADRYNFDEGYFEVDADTGELLYLSLSRPKVMGQNITFKQGEEIAKSIAQKYIDINDYEYITRESSICYGYYYKKKLNGIESSEMFGISFYHDGTLCSVRFASINDLPSPGDKHLYEERINLLTSEEAMNIVNKKIAERYPKINEKDSGIEYEIGYTLCAADENNTLCMLYRIDITESKVIDGEMWQTGTMEWVVVR